MSVLGIVIVAILAVIAAILGAAAGKPNSFTVKRAAEIDAPPEKIFPFLEDFRRWGAWSPWEDIDPNMTKTYGGPMGAGATYRWDGDKKAGAGHMEMTEVRAPAKLALTLTMERPFPASNRVEFFLTPLESATRVAWVMTGPMPFMSKVMSIFVSMDKLLGKDFEKGLARLKAASES
jgi:uncharacterized protein YndB with AHSA1/START domain